MNRSSNDTRALGLGNIRQFQANTTNAVISDVIPLSGELFATNKFATNVECVASLLRWIGRDWDVVAPNRRRSDSFQYQAIVLRLRMAALLRYMREGPIPIHHV